MKKIMLISAVLIMTALIMIAVGGLLVSPGFEKRTDVILIDFSISEDHSVITIQTSLSGSMGYIRDIKTERVNDAIHCSFYSAFGGLNSSIGAKNRFEIQLGDSSDKIYFDRGNGTEALVLERDAAANVWVQK